MNIDLLIKAIDQYRKQNNDTTVITDDMIEDTRAYLTWSEYSDSAYNEYEVEGMSLRDAVYAGWITLGKDDIDAIVLIYAELIKEDEV